MNLVNQRNNSSTWGDHNQEFRGNQAEYHLENAQNQRSSAQRQGESTQQCEITTSGGDSDSSDNINVQNYVGGGPDIEEMEKPLGQSS